MPIDFAAPELVRQLRRAGIRPSDGLVRGITKSFDAAFPALVELATDVDLLHQEEPECYGPIHALRLMGEQPRVEMIAPLLREIPVELDYAEEQLPQLWANEVPQIIGRLGAKAVDPLWEIVDGVTASDEARGTALIALACATIIAPEIRDAVVAGMRERLGRSENKDISSYTVVALADLGAQDAYQEIMDLYRAGKLNQGIMNASVARQLLLAKGEPGLACVEHTLDERYEQHGPFDQARTV